LATRDALVCCAISPDGRLLSATAPTGKDILVWNLETRQRQESFTVPQGYVHRLAFSPDGKRLAASCSADDRRNELWLWDTATRRAAYIFRDFTDEVVVLAFSPDGSKLVTAFPDGPLQLHSAE
jgi:WD40 repeat protein